MPYDHAFDAGLRAQFELRRRQGQRHRDIAQALGVSEGRLIAAHCQAPGDARLQATPLQPHWPALIGALHELGQVMALTRNAGCVHEAIGRYPALPAGTGRVAGEGFELQLHYARWAGGFGVAEQGVRGGLQRSLQFFDAGGQAIHKVVLQSGSTQEAFGPLLARFAGTQPTAFEPVPAAQPAPAPMPAAATQHAAGVQRLLEWAAQQALALTVRVANPGAEQSRSAAVQCIAVMGPWLNILDPGFNLHLRADWIDRTERHSSAVRDVPMLQVCAAGGALLCSIEPASDADAVRWAALVDVALPECVA